VPTFWRPADFPLTEVFIETGTNRGDSLDAALRAGYPSCLSVEFVGDFYRLACERFAHHPQARLFHGSSPEVLPSMIDPAKTTTFWLDAHYSGSDASWQDPRYGECPLLEELKVILAAPWRVPPLLCIDDAFIFQDIHWEKRGSLLAPERFTRSHWPKLADIERLLAGYEIREQNYVLQCRARA
jgi:hypothetical protein